MYMLTLVAGQSSEFTSEANRIYRCHFEEDRYLLVV